MPFKVIQGHRFWYQSKAHMRLPISDPCEYPENLYLSRNYMYNACPTWRWEPQDRNFIHLDKTLELDGQTDRPYAVRAVKISLYVSQWVSESVTQNKSWSCVVNVAICQLF